MLNEVRDAITWMVVGATLTYIGWMATHNCYLFKADAILCTRHAFDFWSIFK